MTKPRVLLVEDRDDIREQGVELLEHEGYEVEGAANASEAIKLFKGSSFPVVVTDLHMEGRPEEGLEVARSIRSIDPETKVIIVTGTSHRKAAVEGYRVNVFAYVEKDDIHGQDALEDAIKRAFEELQELKVKKYMLSFLTHTMRNTFAGAGPALDTALEKSQKLASKLSVDREIFRMISKLAFIKTSLTAVDSMMEAYKLLVRKPENLRRAWVDDREGDVSFTDLIDQAVAASLSRLFCQGAQVSTLNRLTKSVNLNPKELKERYLSDYLLTDEDLRISPTSWLAANFPILAVDGVPPQTPLSQGGIRFSLLFAVVSELCFNAFKYSDGRRPILFRWHDRKDSYELNIFNTYSQASRRKAGSREGQNFIKTVLEPLDGVTVQYQDSNDEEHFFQATLYLSKNLLDGEQTK